MMKTGSACRLGHRNKIMAPSELAAKAEEAAELLNALANKKRLMIVCHLLEGEMSVNVLAEAVGLSQSALSQHLAKLRALGLVATRREAQTIYYRAASQSLGAVIETLHGIYYPSKAA
jgi:ArsR family transcriptional regulator, virulence genes transcriptional regulator